MLPDAIRHLQTPSDQPTILNMWPSARHPAMVAMGSDTKTTAIGSIGSGNED
uniref:Uncharacterized protein n=1 Tax=Caenorhabditis japonica TaxID=281687 RepID=A0A8R1E4N2_CAEJA